MFLYAVPIKTAEINEVKKFFLHNKRNELFLPTMNCVCHAINPVNGMWEDSRVLATFHSKEVVPSTAFGVVPEKQKWLQYGDLWVGLDLRSPFNPEAIRHTKIMSSFSINLVDDTEWKLASVPFDLPKVFQWNGATTPTLETKWTGYENVKGLLEKYYQSMYEISILMRASMTLVETLRKIEDDPERYNEEDSEQRIDEFRQLEEMIRTREQIAPDIEVCKDAIQIIRMQYAVDVPEMCLLENLTVDTARQIILQCVLDRQKLKEDELLKKSPTDVIAAMRS